MTEPTKPCLSRPHFPKRLKFRGQSYFLVLKRYIPECQTYAIYQGPKLLIRGKLHDHYQIADAELSFQAEGSSLQEMLHKLAEIQKKVSLRGPNRLSKGRRPLSGTQHSTNPRR